MFVGTGFSLGFTVADIQAQLAGLLGNPVVDALVAAAIALIFAPRILGFIKRVARH